MKLGETKVIKVTQIYANIMLCWLVWGYIWAWVHQVEALVCGLLLVIRLRT